MTNFPTDFQTSVQKPTREIQIPLTPYAPPCLLRSSDKCLHTQPQTCTSISKRAFIVCESALWNSIPLHIRLSPWLASFKRNLKTLYSSLSQALWICPRLRFGYIYLFIHLIMDWSSLIITIYFENVPFPRWARVRRLPQIKSLHISLKIATQNASQAASCHPSHTVPTSSYSCPDPSPPPPSTFCKQTPNHLHSYVQDVQTISIFHASPHQQHN